MSETKKLNLGGVMSMFFTIQGWSGTTHFCKEDGNTLCGAKIEYEVNERCKVKIENQELLEFWNENSNVQKPKWVRVSKYSKCQRCLKTLEKNYS